MISIIRKGIHKDDNTENVTSVPENLSKRKKLDSLGTTHNAWQFKMLLIFGACCIIGCYLIPFAVYAIQFRSNTEIGDDYSDEKI